MASTGFDGVYATSVSGIGVKIIQRLPLEQIMRWPRISEPVSPGRHRPMPAYTLMLIKTGPVTPGRLSLPALTVSRTYAGLSANRLSLANNQAEVILENPTCTLDPASRHTQVNLGEHSQARLRGIGSMTPVVHFSLRLNCVGGAEGGRLSIHANVTDASVPGNTKEHLHLTADSTAKGVGIRLMRTDGTPVILGPAGSPGQWLAATAITGMSQLTLGLKTAYLQTESLVVPGTANGRAIVTLAYE
ncbi:type 1 fimbrial protein [Pseudomonas sp. LS1212]|nr:fimbrial protein [Pseudomonas sp. LS1212]UVJ46077.1 type 1 fimbrial protein [Pseudomonas sp. LS1212]